MAPVGLIHPLVVMSFPPAVTIAGVGFRLETLAVAATILLALLLARFIAGRTPVDIEQPLGASSSVVGGDDNNRLHQGDLLYIAMAAIPGALIGGRLGYGLIHLDYLSSHPGILWNLTWGGLQLSLGVVGGIITAVLVAVMIGAPVRRWLHVLALPLLLTLAGGKLAMILGGSGQGLAWDGVWATAYQGVGPWGSLGPDVPSYPSQAIEGIATFGIFLIVGWLMLAGVFRAKSGSAFALGLGMWAIARVVVATTWRDPYVTGPLRMDQLISLWIALICLGTLAMVFLWQFAGRDAEPAGSV